MKVKIFLLIALACQFYAPLVWPEESEQKPPTFLLPWQTIGEKFADNAESCSIECAEKTEKQAEKCQDCELGENNFILQLPSEVTKGDWKKDLLAFCRFSREQIETNPDPQLIYSSIAISHFDNVMELVSKAPVLSKNILTALALAIKSKHSFDKNECPNLVKGLNRLILKRFDGAVSMQFAIHIPADYVSSKKWPVYIHVDPRGWGINKYGEYGENEYHEGMIDLWWHTIHPKNILWKGYTLLFEILKEKLNLDDDRIYIHGQCANGPATMAMLLHHPDNWAECSITSGNSFRHLAGNAINVPFVFGNAHTEYPFHNASINFVAKYFKNYGSKYFKYDNNANIPQIRGTELPQTVRKTNPKRVLFTTESLGNPKAYWVKIEGRQDENFVARIDALVQGQSILINTTNIDAYSLDLVQAPLDSNMAVEIIENGKSLGFATGPAFTKKSEKYENAAIIKNELLHGPVRDVFTEPFVIIWGSGGEDKEVSESNEKLARTMINSGISFTNVKITEEFEKRALTLVNGGPCFADVNVPVELIKTHNIILVGRPKSNLWLAKIAKKLPVQIKNGQVITHSASYDGRDVGLILVYPNPLNSQKYVAVFSGTSKKAMANISKAYAQMRSFKPSDIGIFEVTENDEIKWHRIEKFNTIWDWHEQWNTVLTQVNKKHPKWQWRQWIAKALREELESDVMICEEPFEFSDFALDGRITYRDICTKLKNYWIVKVSLNGKSLKNLLKASINKIDEEDISFAVIDGISLVKPNEQANKDALEISELIDDKTYTVAFNYEAFSQQGIGLTLTDYKIVGQGYLVLLLNDYLRKNKEINLDDELDSTKLNIF